MATLNRVRTTLTGFPGGPGVSTMYFLDLQTALASVRAFWAALEGALPVNVTVQVQNTGDMIESTTGALVGSWAKPAVLPVFGTVPGNYSAPTGALVTWLTSTIADRRRLRGRTFIVPAAGTIFENNGSINAATLTSLENAAQALVFEQSISFVVWHRPVEAKPANGTIPAVPARGGSYGLVTASRAPDKAVVLRSRRD